MTTRTSESPNMTTRGPRWGTLVKAYLAATLAGIAALTSVGSAGAVAHIDAFDYTATNADGSPSVQAGAHPYQVMTSFVFPSHVDGQGRTLPDESPRNLTVELPAGLVGNPTAMPACTEPQLELQGGCPRNAQIGYVGLVTSGITLRFPLFNMKAPPGKPAEFGFFALAVAVHLEASVRSGGDYGINVTVKDLPQTLPWTATSVTIWGVPADPSHDADRGGPSQAPRTPFLTNPSACSTATTAIAHADSWQAAGVFDTATSSNHDNGGPAGITGCERLPFDPSITAHPSVRTAGSPAGLTVKLHVPQSDNPDGLATATLEKAVVTLPAGVSVSPSSADGLEACSTAQVGLQDGNPASCPDGSKIGSVQIDTPLLDDPLTGSIYLARQGSNPFNSLLAIYVVVSGDGVVIKLAGHVEPDPVTGQLRTTFDNNPQLPFTDFELTFKDGPRAALANPEACGNYTTTAQLQPYGGGPTVTTSDAFAIDVGCSRGFSPSFEAGTTNPAGGGGTTFGMKLARADTDEDLGTVAMTMPPGLLGNLKSVALCPEPGAGQGACAQASQVGTTTVGSGPGTSPFHLGGPVYLTGPYKEAPFGLSIVVPALAGPFNLGTVVVRAAISVDPKTAVLTVVADPLPSILQGIPLRLRTVNVTIDRPGFMFNPTSCGASQVSGTIGSTVGTQRAVASRFQAANCAALGFKPSLSIALTGKGQTTDGKHPGLAAHLAPRVGDANAKKVVAQLPLSLALDPDNANGLCEPTDAAANKCPALSIVGTAKAVSILHVPLSGPVYFVRGVRTDPKSGRQIRTLPKLYIPLSGEGVRIDVNASSEVIDDRLVTTFDNLPDAPLASFDLTINGGKHGILVVSHTNICRANQATDSQFAGQNKKTATAVVSMATPCDLGIQSSSHTASSLKLVVGGLGAGKVTVSGEGLTTTRRTITSATVATLQATLAKSAKAALAAHHDVRVKVTVSFLPTGAKKAKVIHKTLVIHGKQ
jgi:hypothetical protein